MRGRVELGSCEGYAIVARSKSRAAVHVYTPNLYLAACLVLPHACLVLCCRPYLTSRASVGTCRRAGLSFSLRTNGTGHPLSTVQWQRVPADKAIIPPHPGVLTSRHERCLSASCLCDVLAKFRIQACVVDDLCSASSVGPPPPCPPSHLLISP